MRLVIESSTQEARKHLRLLELHVHYSILCCRERAGQLTDLTRQRLEFMRPVFHGDRHRGRRTNKRYPVHLPCVIKFNETEQHGILLELSAGGAFITSTRSPLQGALVLVKVGYPRRLEFLFTCSVAHNRDEESCVGFGCRFNAAPLEIRYSEPTEARAPPVRPQALRRHVFDAEQWPLFPSDSSAFDSTDIPDLAAM